VTFTKDDLKRVAWTFVQAGLGVALVYGTGWLEGEGFEWRAVLSAVIAAGISAVKNLVLADGSELK
jgi:ferric-dicitrate binding protein FerR (iron transport regulator)